MREAERPVKPKYPLTFFSSEHERFAARPEASKYDREICSTVATMLRRQEQQPDSLLSLLKEWKEECTGIRFAKPTEPERMWPITQALWFDHGIATNSRFWCLPRDEAERAEVAALLGMRGVTAIDTQAYAIGRDRILGARGLQYSEFVTAPHRFEQGREDGFHDAYCLWDLSYGNPVCLSLRLYWFLRKRYPTAMWHLPRDNGESGKMPVTLTVLRRPVAGISVVDVRPEPLRPS